MWLLSEHASFLSQKIGFLMEATMGFINAEQNQIIKIFSWQRLSSFPDAGCGLLRK